MTTLYKVMMALRSAVFFAHLHGSGFLPDCLVDALAHLDSWLLVSWLRLYRRSSRRIRRI